MEQQFYVESDRLIMRLAKNEEIHEVLDYVTRNREHLEPYAPKVPEAYYTKERWEKFITRTLEDAEKQRAMRFFIFKKEDNKRIIGLVNFEFIKFYPMYKCTVGYSMDEQEQGKGYMTEALRAATNYMLKEWNLMRIEGGYSPTNPASGCVMRKVGFEEGHIVKKDILINGEWEDIMYMYLYNDEWIERKSCYKA